MILLYGQSGSGKTEYFINKFPKHRILHASSLNQLRRCINSINSPFLDRLPTLVNTWFDLDVATILDLAKLDVYIEAHYMETPEGIKISMAGKKKHYWGLTNERLLQKINPSYIVFFPPRERNQRKMNMIELFGTRYNWIRSQFPEVL